MALPSESDLANQLFQAAQAQAGQHGLQLGAGATNRLRELAKTGATKILSEAKAKSDAQDAYVKGATRVAVESMNTLVDEMTSIRSRVPRDLPLRSESIGDQNLTEALRVLCPLWPFC